MLLRMRVLINQELTKMIVLFLEELKVRTILGALAGTETVEFAGKCIRHLLIDEHIAEKSGRVFNTVDLAHEFGFKDVDGKMPIELLALRNMLLFRCYYFGKWVPAFIRCPKLILTLIQHKF